MHGKTIEQANMCWMELEQKNHQHGDRVVEKITKEISGVGKFKRRPLQNEDDMKVMFGDINNNEQDHCNPMSLNPIIPMDDDLLHDDNPEGNEDPIGEDNGNEDEVEEVTPVIPITENANRKAKFFLEKLNKTPKSSTTFIIQEHISKISESASSFVASRHGVITIECFLFCC